MTLPHLSKVFAARVEWGDITGELSGQEDLNSILSNLASVPPGSVAWGNISGTLSGQTDLSEALSDKVDKVTGKSLSTNDYTTAEQTKLAGIASGANVGVVPNTAITGASKTKITYDAKGLITAGVDATTADIADSSDKRYCTDAQKTAIGTIGGKAPIDNPTFTTNVTTPILVATGAITSSGGGVGYAAGAGGAVTQLSSRTTTVVLNKLCGNITMYSAAQAAAAVVTFTLTNSFIDASDMVIINHISATNAGCWHFSTVPAAGSCAIYIKNISSGSITSATPLRFVVIKAAIT